MKTKIFTFLMLFCSVSFLSFSQDKKDEFPKTKFSGLIFGDYYYNAVRDTAFNPIFPSNNMVGTNASSGKAGENSVQVRRVLFAIEHKLAKNLDGVFRLESNPDSKIADDKFGVYLKDCNIKWGYYKTHNLQFGLFSTGAWDISESFWGHRYVEKTITDLRGATAARDLGIGLNGKLDSIGKFKYSVMFGEGTGVKVTAVDWYKRYYVNLSYSPILELNDKKEVTKEFTLSLYYDRNEKKSIVDSVDFVHYANGVKVKKFKAGKNLNTNSQNVTFLAGYKEKDKYSFGLEIYYSMAPYAFFAKGVNTPSDTMLYSQSKFENKNGMGISIFGTYNVNEKIDVFARFDYFEPNSNANKYAKGDKRNYIIAGLGYSPVKGMTISPNVLMETYEKKIDGITNKDFTKSDQAIKSSITPRLTFLYVFK